jgi:hypothetical protein
MTKDEFVNLFDELYTPYLAEYGFTMWNRNFLTYDLSINDDVTAYIKVEYHYNNSGTDTIGEYGIKLWVRIKEYPVNTRKELKKTIIRKLFPGKANDNLIPKLFKKDLDEVLDFIMEE